MKNLNVLLYVLMWIFFQCTSSDPYRDQVKPESNRFEIELLAEDLNQPMSMDILNDGRVLIVEKDGAVKVFDPNSNQVNTIAEIPVNKRFSQPYTTSGNKYDADDGMHGVLLDPNFDVNKFIYLYYSPESEDPKSLLVRYKWEGDSLDLDSKNILLEWSTQRERCCHWGGGMVFDQDGNLLLAIGDNSGFNLKTEFGDSRRTSGNSNDLRGSILRIKPELDGTYTIPDGNLFSEKNLNSRPEIYIMGVRNPWRLSTDSKTGWLYWGEVGESTDEFNSAQEAGNFGWPFFIGNNEKNAKIETEYDTTHITNNSPYNTGLTELPSPPVPALVWYDRNPSEIFPIPGSGSLSAVGGPFYRKADFASAIRPFPAYYDGKWFVTDYVRGWVMVIEVDEKGNFKAIEEFMPEGTFTGINDMDFAPNGDLYILQYGHDSYESYAKDAKLFRIKYNDGNRKPIAKATSDKRSGSVPMEVTLLTKGTIDYDNNINQYKWIITSENGEYTTFNEQQPVVSINIPGVYQAILTVTDSEGATDSDTLEIITGNDPPKVTFEFFEANSSFYFPGDQLQYSVHISDQEDEEIDYSRMNVWADYLPEGFNLKYFIETIEKSSTYLPAKSILGEQLIEQNKCNQCHYLDQKAVGPSFKEIENRYQEVENVYELLSEKIIGGTRGTWGQAEMPAHPSITLNEANAIIEFILNSTEKNESRGSLPISGSISVPDEANAGYMIFKASYKDSGFEEIPSIETVEIVGLRDSRVFVSDVDTTRNMRLYVPHFKQPNHLIPNDTMSFIGLRNIDLSGINKVSLDLINLSQVNDSGWGITIRTNSVNGEIIGSTMIGDMVEVDEGFYQIQIQPISGKRDLYIEFNNNSFKKDLVQFEIRSLKFIK
ncbi:PQQ-dependent sugar dehydrogenase [Lunatibacter salilacus]|uniref:PQQ-dependent sugar dehydrogenase n=1 Tax=Lunatibacter salilacus TaxID=2483804 RepID=UPI00131BA0C4|nr:PQQ-dependent sugar dehydrogenase [Lunatibacter salilacus]